MNNKYLASEHPSDQNFSRQDLQHLLIMRPETIGDVVMLAPALRTLRETLPEARMTLLTSSRGSQAAPLLPWVDHVMVYPALWEGIAESTLLNLRKDMAFIESLREQRFSMAMIFSRVAQSPWISAYACYLAGIPQRLGFAKEVSGSAFTSFLLPPDDDVHQLDRNLHLLQALGIYQPNPRMELSISAEMESQADELLVENGIRHEIPYIVLSPESGLANDLYDPQYFAAAVRILSAQTELQMVIVGSSEGVEAIQPVLQVADENLYGNVHSLIGKTTLPELAAVIRGARLTITNKSATVHLAEAFQCPMIVLYPGTDPISSWTPRTPSARVLSQPASCSVCSEADCRSGMKCLEIRPEEIAIAALELLGEETYSPATHHVLQEYRSERSSL